MALDPSRLANNIIADLFPNFNDLDAATKAQVTDSWTKISTRIINEFKENAVINASLDDSTINGNADTETGEITATVNSDSVSGSIE